MNSGFFIIILLMLLVMWLFLIRPQRRRQQTQQQMLSNLRRGDEVLTAGGFYGTIARVGDDEVTVELAPGTEVRLAKRAITAVIPSETAEAQYEDEEEGLEEEELEEADEAEQPADEVEPTGTARS